MKILTSFLSVSAIAMLSPLASASVYTGAWNNRTFGSTGALTIDFEVGAKKVTGSIDFDGPVFGAGDPPAIPFNTKLKKDGSGTFLITGTDMGDLKGNFKPDGTLSLVISNIPGGFLTDARIDGKFDLKVEGFSATYQINTASGLFAEGDAEAHVPQKPTVKVPKKVRFSGKRGRATAKVLTNTGIKKINATAKNAKVKVTGKNPYKIIVTKAKKKTTRVKLTVINDDGFKTTRFIKFIKKGN